jgi:two-component system cell cycle response regulator
MLSHPTMGAPKDRRTEASSPADELTARGLHSDIRPIADELRMAGATPQMSVSSSVRLDRAMLTMFSGPDVGAVFALVSGETIIGRGADATLRLDEPSVSRLHAKITRIGSDAYLLEDLGSANGTYVGGRPIRRAALRSGDRVQLGRECVFRFTVVDESEESLQRRLYEASMRDELTGIANRRCLFARLAGELGNARRGHRPLSLVLLDVDHFKVINDTFGHIVGDRVLRAICARCAEAVRGGDLLARYGGEELALLAREADHAEACRLAERLHDAIVALRVDTPHGAIAVTASIGLASLSECDPKGDGLALFALADARLYSAKAAGRDRICAKDEGT